MKNGADIIRDLAATPRMYNFATVTDENKPWVRYVFGSADESFAISFATCISSRKVTHIRKNEAVHLTCGISDVTDLGKPYLQITGKATVHTDRETCRAFWYPALENIYRGPDDPDYAVITVAPQRIEVWNNGDSDPLVWLPELADGSERSEYFDQVAVDWDRMRGGFFSEKIRDAAYAVASPEAGAVAIDLGAGTGFITEGLLKSGVRVIAVDASQSMLEQMRVKFGETEQLTLRCADGENIPMGTGIVDYVFANMFLHHVENPSEVIRECARVLKPGGQLIITDLDEHEFEFLKTEHHDRWMGFQREVVSNWFSEAGLSRVNVTCVGDRCSAVSSDATTSADVNVFIAHGVK